MGVTPTSGALTPAYKPLANPSLAIVLFTTSIAPLYTPFSAVCNRTFTRSNGCPTITAHTPPTPPETSARSDCADFLLAALTSSFNSSFEGKFSALSGLSSFVVIVATLWSQYPEDNSCQAGAAGYMAKGQPEFHTRGVQEGGKAIFNLHVLMRLLQVSGAWP